MAFNPRVPRNDPRIDAYIAKSADFAKPVLIHLRKLVHAACPEVEETMKWNFPHFMHQGILCGMGAFKQHCTFGFWKRELVLGKALGARREDSMGQFGRITAVSDLPAEKILLGYIRKAAALNEAGVKTPERKPTKKKKLIMPPDFSLALKRNKAALTTFENFSPSHKREYVDWITRAKREETRNSRLSSAIAWLAEGKARNWKYERC
jgi:uncharacterized protein YdeI (YjbR/CyaY-like superfamily)